MTVRSRRPPLPRAALIGTGYIGGSLALALSQAGRVERWVGYDSDAARLQRARRLGIVGDVASGVAEAVRGADLVVIAVPVMAGPRVLQEACGVVNDDTLLMDVGSTKASILKAAATHLASPGQFVGCHPIAGLELTGPQAANVNLFRGRLCIVTPVAETVPGALEDAAALWMAAGARLVQMTPAHHDRVLAAVSHLTHVVAYSLIGTLAGLEGDVGRDVVGLSGAGLRDTTRIASSNPEMWRAIFLDNREAVLEMVGAFATNVEALRRLIEEADGERLVELLGEARDSRARLLEQP